MSDSGSQPGDDLARWTCLTEKQRACLDLVIDHQTSKQIARRLGISKQAVDLRIKNARDTLGVANRAETAIVYARLRQTYDRMPCDPIILAPRPALMSFESPNGGLPDAMHDRGSLTNDPTGSSPPFGDFWRRDHIRVKRVWIMATLLVGLALLILTGLAIAQALTRLVSG